ncbi:MAG TPA: 3-hydroxyacyl-CoA dehydrogenase NAD-binding domain-containing protein [Geobacteraceae bacterium]|nr:3-hydroxyacyl-CoA dehydrogenase NAD-binding domain-containing protein [Geobacteraceae bacterium]
MTIRKIAVVGAGTMGSGIARAAAGSGFEVTLLDRDDALAACGLSKIREGLDRKVRSGEFDGRVRDDMLSILKSSGKLGDCADADLVIEAAAEQEPIKREIFKTLDQICPTGTIFSTNTSSISITRLASVTNRPDRFIGMHFMNPAYVMKLVEIVTGLRTSSETVAAIKAVAGKMGKTAIVVGDSPGFVANRILMPMINDAICCLHEGIASRESIDEIARSGANHPMGPLELADFIGLDICLEIMDVLHSELGEKYRPCPLLRKMVAAGKLGKKSGEGFYEYR